MQYLHQDGEEHKHADNEHARVVVNPSIQFGCHERAVLQSLDEHEVHDARGLDASEDSDAVFQVFAEVVGEELEKIQERYHEIMSGSYLDDILEQGAQKARVLARKKLAKVERKIGITIKKK